MEVVPSDFMKLPGRIPPPRSWVDSAGKTPGWKACDSGKGKHSVACQARYSEWLESHDVSASGSKVVVSPSPGDVEPDLLDDQQEVVGHEYVPTTPEGSDGEKKAAVSHWSSHDREKRRKVEVESSPDPYFTRRCPACESGMDVPGIRHNAECRKKRASLQAQPPSSRPEVSLPSSAPHPVVVPDIPAAPLPQRIWPLWISRCWMVQQVLMRIQLRPWSLGWWICVSVECCSIHRVCQVWI